jgi:hypothetical protein
MEQPRVERRLAAFMTVGRIVAEPIFLRTLFSWGDGGRSNRGQLFGASRWSPEAAPRSAPHIDNHGIAIVALYLYGHRYPERVRDCHYRSWRCLIST